MQKLLMWVSSFCTNPCTKPMHKNPCTKHPGRRVDLRSRGGHFNTMAAAPPSVLSVVQTDGVAAGQCSNSTESVCRVSRSTAHPPERRVSAAARAKLPGWQCWRGVSGVRVTVAGGRRPALRHLGCGETAVSLGSSNIQHFTVHLFVHTQHSRKAGTFPVARLRMDLPFQNSSRVHRRSASPLG